MSQLKYDCTDQEHIDWVLENQKYGGGFQHYLVEAWRRADGENKARLEKAFPYDYRIPLGKPEQTREEWLEKFRPLDRPPIEDTEDEAGDMLYGVDNNQ